MDWWLIDRIDTKWADDGCRESIFLFCLSSGVVYGRLPGWGAGVQAQVVGI